MPVTDVALARLAANVSVTTFATGLQKPRGLAVTPQGDFLVVERGAYHDACITVLWDSDGDGVSSDAERERCIASAGLLNHGIALFGGYLFASSDTTVYRWEFHERNKTSLPRAENRRVIVQGIAHGADGSDLGADQGHETRTLAFDHRGRLFISVGSNGNVDDDSFRSRVRGPFVGLAAAGAVTATFNDGGVWADGLRNEVGLAFDAKGVLWGVENGADNLNRDDIGGDVHNENPGEELNRLDKPGAFYGYPRCWSEHTLAAPHGLGRTTQWAWPSFMPGTTDEWCRDANNVVPPAMVMPAHTAPLGITFFGAPEAHRPAANESACTLTMHAGGAFPCAWRGDAFVALHGSWNRQPPVGYSVVRLPFDGDAPTGEVIPLFEHGGSGAAWPGGRTTGMRPVDIRFDQQGRLMFTSDRSGELMRLQFEGGALPDASGEKTADALPAGVVVVIVAVAACAAALTALGLVARAMAARARPAGAASDAKGRAHHVNEAGA